MILRPPYRINTGSAFIDYRSLNEQIIADKYPLANVAELIDIVASKSIFSVLDLSGAFHNQVLTEDSKKISKQISLLFVIRSSGRTCAS